MEKENIKILILEDHTLSRIQLKRFISKLGYEIAGAVGNVEEAMKVFSEKKPHLAILDAAIVDDKTKPENGNAFEGIDFGKKIMQQRPIPIIFITNYSEEVLKKALGFLPAAILSKPYREKDIRNAIEIAVYQHYGAIKEFANVRFGINCVTIKERDLEETEKKESIVYLEASNNDTLVFVDGKRKKFLVKKDCYLVCGISISNFLECLPPRHFAQTHRSYAVGLKHVKGHTRNKVLLKDGREVKLSEGYRENFIYKFDRRQPFA